MKDEIATFQATPRQLAILQLAVLVVAICAIIYELIIATVSSYLLGDSVYQFSITIGLFMFAMGLGSYVTKLLTRHLLTTFLAVELILAAIGGTCSTTLFLVFPYGTAYRPTMYVLTILIGMMVGLEIPILLRILAERGGVRKSVAHVLSLDYIGALIGSVSFPLLLLPDLGLFRSSFAIGLLNIAVAFATLLAFRKQIPRAGLFAAATALLAIGLAAGAVFAITLTSFAEGQLYRERIVYLQQTPYQRIVVTNDDRTNVPAMYLDGHLQFDGRDEYRYHEGLVHPLLSMPGGRASVLILGGGDGMAAREVLRYDDVQSVTLVDIDPAVTEFCRTFPAIRELNRGALDDPRLTVVHTDAFQFVRACEQRFDRIVLDLPDPHNEALAKLYSVEFYRMLKSVLHRSGALVTQSTSPLHSRRAFSSIRATLSAADFLPLSYHLQIPSFGPWGFHLAALQRQPSMPAMQLETQFLHAELLQAATVFGNDEAPVDGVVNSIFEPKLYELYNRANEK
ncbi:MAG: polyamine aminopropyltransferase [Planctomycetota bacterium]